MEQTGSLIASQCFGSHVFCKQLKILFFSVECVHIQEILAEWCDNWIINTSNITDPIRYTKYSGPEIRGDSSGQDKTTVYRDIPQAGQYQHSEAIQVSIKVREEPGFRASSQVVNWDFN